MAENDDDSGESLKQTLPSVYFSGHNPEFDLLKSDRYLTVGEESTPIPEDKGIASINLADNSEHLIELADFIKNRGINARIEIHSPDAYNQIKAWEERENKMSQDNDVDSYEDPHLTFERFRNIFRESAASVEIDTSDMTKAEIDEKEEAYFDEINTSEGYEKYLNRIKNYKKLL